MLTFTTSTGMTAIPIKDYDKLQKMNLEAIKFKGKSIVGFDKITAYYPETRFKNVMRNNDDGSVDLIINPSVAKEISTGYLNKRNYMALHLEKEKPMLGSEKLVAKTVIQVPEKEIVSSFDGEMSISEVEEVLERAYKKGIKYNV